MRLHYCLQTRPHRQITIDYDIQNSNSQTYLPHHQQNQRALSSLENSSSTDNTSSVPNSPAKVEPPKHQFIRAEQLVLPKPSSNAVVDGVGIQHRRTNSGSSSRDNYRASLRAKHRRDMQEKVLRQQEQQQNNQTSRNGPSNPNSQSSNRVLGAIKKQPISSQNRGT